MDTNALFEQVKTEQNAKTDRIKPLLIPLTGILKVKSTKTTNVKTTLVIRHNMTKRQLPDWKRGFSDENDLMRGYRIRCEAGEEIQIRIEADEYDITLNERLALILIDEKDFIAEIAAYGWKIYIV